MLAKVVVSILNSCKSVVITTLDSQPQADIFYKTFDVPIPGISTRDCQWLGMTIQPGSMPDRKCG